jgi:glycine cleavage system H protein
MDPQENRYTKEHEWTKIEGNKTRIGITAYAQEHLGDIVFVDLPAIGKSFKRGEVLLVVESVKSASDTYAPLSGTVVAVNDALNSAPELVNKDPYGEGWMVELELTNPAQTQDLLSAEEYATYIAGLA